MAILSIDIGTTGTKAVVFDETGKILTLAYQEYALVYPKPGWAEVSGETIWAAVGKTVRKAAEKHGKQVTALCLSCMGQNIIPVRKDGTAIRNGILAFDARTTAEVQFIRETIGAEAYFKIRGALPAHMFGESKILWLKRHEPETFRETWKFMTFGDYIRTRLGFPGIIDISMAASGLPFDIQKQDYSDTIIEALGFNRGQFSEVVASDQLLGELNQQLSNELGLPAGVKVVAGGHDAICGILGAGVTQNTPNIIADINGTWESIAYIRSKPILTKKAMENQVGSSCSVLKNTYMVIQALSTSGSVVRWFRDELAHEERLTAEQTGENVYDTMFALLAFNGGTMMCIPCFAGSATDAYEKGAFLGMGLGTTHQQMLQSVVEGVTHEMTVLVDRLAGLSETPIDTLRAFGGPTKSAKWLQLKADISGKKIEAVQVEEASALGAALLAGVASGVYNSYEQAIEATLKIKAIYQPRPEIHKIYQRQHHVYQQLTGALSPVNKALFDI